MIDYKLHVLAYKVVYGIGPEYLQELLTLYTPGHESLYSKHALVVARAPSATIGERSFQQGNTDSLEQTF